MLTAHDFSRELAAILAAPCAKAWEDSNDAPPLALQMTKYRGSPSDMKVLENVKDNLEAVKADVRAKFVAAGTESAISW